MPFSIARREKRASMSSAIGFTRPNDNGARAFALTPFENWSGKRVSNSSLNPGRVALYQLSYSRVRERLYRRGRRRAILHSDGLVLPGRGAGGGAAFHAEVVLDVPDPA